LSKEIVQQIGWPRFLEQFMEDNKKPPRQKTVCFHVDMDGLNSIYKGHGYEFSETTDRFYLTAIDNSLSFFEEQGITATYFLIASDLDDREKLNRIKVLVRAGHKIACHGLNHRYLFRLTTKGKREEIITGKKKIEDTLGIPCHGFRAPGFSIDYESLTIIQESGFLYDSSLFPHYHFMKRLGIWRLLPEPFFIFPQNGLFEFPLPSLGPFLPPFHPCYAFYFSRYYYFYCLKKFFNQYNFLTLLFHFTDFADPQKLGSNFRLQFFTNNFFSTHTKLSFLRTLMEPFAQDFRFVTSENFVQEWSSATPPAKPDVILGISTTHETGACLVKGGKVLAAINEERLSRKKFDTTYPPVESIREVIRLSGVTPNSIDAVSIAGLEWKDLLARTIDSLWNDVRDFHAWNDYVPHLCRIFYRVFSFWRATHYGRLQSFLQKEFGINPKVYYIEHHEAHAASAYRTGSEEEALIITADGVGDDISITFSKGQKGCIRRSEEFFYPNSFGQFYTACTQILGFKAGHHEGKITGLSGYGKPNHELILAIEKTYFVENRFKLNKYYYSEGFLRPRPSSWRDLLRGKIDFNSFDYRNYKMPLKKLLKGYPREEVAFAYQFLLEREMNRLARYHCINSNPPIVLAGGVFANVKLNMGLSQDLAPKSLYVFPNMGDGGLCVGAALSITGSSPTPLPNAYLGTEFTDGEIHDALKTFPRLFVSRPLDLARTVAKHLVKGHVVARFDGRMEFGPRALGNRSILYHCRDRSVNEWLNRQLNRTEFMPFAPIVLYEDAEKYFLLRQGEKRTCEFMTLVVQCTELMQENCPAAVHVDGSARPQLLKREVNPGMYAILKEYKELAGISCLINTSFNMHEEPIVRTPKEAITAFLQSHLDALILGPFLVRSSKEYDPVS